MENGVSGKITDMETLVRYPAEGSTVAMDILAEKCFCYRHA